MNSWNNPFFRESRVCLTLPRFRENYKLQKAMAADQTLCAAKYVDARASNASIFGEHHKCIDFSRPCYLIYTVALFEHRELLLPDNDRGFCGNARRCNPWGTIAGHLAAVSLSTLSIAAAHRTCFTLTWIYTYGPITVHARATRSKITQFDSLCAIFAMLAAGRSLAGYWVKLSRESARGCSAETVLSSPLLFLDSVKATEGRQRLALRSAVYGTADTDSAG